ncbi:hypothetical protein P154DRAFT_454671 [Amniculicola lignicola CBS 123094]|uniref:HRQ family protein 2 n=1 Tax=Amniculicola lignicola CBS 123094 TaxID=1392246 RepID=A0A6A5WZD0_9PLEO|nr:hypothetical protein P154DRAFT_454671 [Amniculicola lignicola CBS 123094]
MIQLDLIRLSHSWVLVLIGVVWVVYRRIRQGKSVKLDGPSENAKPQSPTNAYYDIEPLKDFNLETTEPIKIRPFKPKYHLTMAIENTTLSDLVAMDKTYTSRMQLRKHLLTNHFSSVLATNPKATASIYEFYSWITKTYLPSRFPTIYTLTPNPPGLKNHTTGEILPLHPPSPTSALQILGQNIDTDFLFLLPSSSPQDSSKYRLEAFITCFPSGFNTPKKLNMLLSEIHGPVPGYAAKLEKSMDRFFASLPVGKIVKRLNWSVTTTRELFCLAGTHLTEDEMAGSTDMGLDGGEADRTLEWQREEVDPEDCVLRCERQTLHRLPESGALVFGFKTYQYEMRDVKAEGSGEALADAIEGLGRGSVPGMRVYKREVVWGEKVKRFLRGEV